MPFGDQPGTAWADYALAAPLMVLRDSTGELGRAPDGLGFGDWVR